MREPNPLRTTALTAAALAGFAANSLLCRRALGGQQIDAASFTLVRLGSGALTLALLARLSAGARRAQPSGGWISAAALFVYAAAFSLAYLRLGAGVGALVLFGCVQATMIGWGVRSGERPHALEWSGLALALGGLALLALRGANAPDPSGLGLMLVAGIAWGVYSLLGRRTQAPLATTAANFLRSLPFALAFSLASVSLVHASASGVALAIASGALASGVGYSFWFAALPHLSATRAAVVQLAVPALAAAGGVLWLGEVLTARLALASAAILGGVALAVVFGKARRKA